MQSESEIKTIDQKFFSTIIERYRTAWRDRQFKIGVPIAVLLFAAAVAANTLAGLYATDRASNSVTDIILSNTPVFDVDLLYIYGSFAITVFIAMLLLYAPRTIPFTLCTLALFWLVRAIFISLTHIGPYPDAVPLNFQNSFLLHLYGGGEFFSGHTGAPFLMALVFWNTKWLRAVFLITCAFFAAIVLLGHLHYTIDVLSAFFITYGIYHLALHLFVKEHALFLQAAADPIPPERSLIIVKDAENV